jgi:hypothetical protein
MSDRSKLAKLREPFPANQISKLPKPTKAQTDAVKADWRKGVRCDICGAWHHPEVVHLDYVGHAALTDRLLDTDPNWNWEPATGSLELDQNNGLWISLTVCGVTRLGYGHAENKRGGDAVKEVIGDAIRNAAMRFGAALDLWHKGDLHAHLVDDPEQVTEPSPKPVTNTDPEIERLDLLAHQIIELLEIGDEEEITRICMELTDPEKEIMFRGRAKGGLFKTDQKTELKGIVFKHTAHLRNAS